MRETTEALAMPEWVPPDQAARERIQGDLLTNLLVEAGAGSGKTHSMVGRMVELIRTGTATVDQVAAVTFTRKAAGELRERFQVRLEATFGAATDAAERERLQRALTELDRCFIGTIHSFCGRLLRERPLDAGVSPDFQEVSGPEEDRLRAESWTRLLERLAARDSRLLKRLGAVGLRPSQLTGVFRELSGNPDVRYLAAPAPLPPADAVERWTHRLGALLDETLALMPGDEPAAGWDSLQKLARTLRRSRFFPGWGSTPVFLDALATAVDEAGAIRRARAERKHRVTFNRWAAPKAVMEDLEESWEALAGGSSAHALVLQWRAHRYRIVLRFARAAAGFYARERLHSGHLTFQDLLLLTARLLRESAVARSELGLRYRFLLVDEFQDTDPLQAEVLFLLAAEEGSGAEWTRAVPRPGALFVVGDPKQSIYRFRRADISIYNQVKARFQTFGAVLPLVTNFRSTPPIERLVERVFHAPAILPAEPTAHQAAFAPLRVKPCDAERAARAGVRWYGFDTPGGGMFSGRRVFEPDAANVASWIAGEIEAGRREPGDFMVLTRTKKCLREYAAALEARGIAVQATGAGVGMEAELHDLVLLLKALLDPADGVCTVAVLEGLFYGQSHAELFEHLRLGGRFDLTRTDHPASSPVAPALAQLHRFWRTARRLPADAAVSAIAAELGILPHAAAGELGATRAGALLYALDALRTAGLRGECSLAAAVEVLEMALEQEVDTPLIPGRTDVVRLMNLHKSKGLEAPVVILAYPVAEREHPAVRHVSRGVDGTVVGYLCVEDAAGRGVLARPLDWEVHAEAEAVFAEAEDVRLLYVAVTRAADELVVARCEGTKESSVWRALHGALDDGELASELAIALRRPVERPRPAITTGELRARVEEVERARARLARPSYRSAPVTARVKDPAATGVVSPAQISFFQVPPPAARGPEWGRAVHRAMETAARGVLGMALRTACRSFLIDEDRPLDSHGEPTELEELIRRVEALQHSSLLHRARRAGELFIEVPFTLALPSPEAVALGLAPAPDIGSAAGVEVVDGVIDLAFLEPGGWVIADYKTDAAPSAAASLAYRRQVEAYARCWNRVTGAPVKERVLLFTAQGREESW
jgi:ATP-dependent helicase/nuclease subunit A